jgi:hypothetical protein
LAQRRQQRRRFGFAFAAGDQFSLFAALTNAASSLLNRGASS